MTGSCENDSSTLSFRTCRPAGRLNAESRMSFRTSFGISKLTDIPTPALDRQVRRNDKPTLSFRILPKASLSGNAESHNHQRFPFCKIRPHHIQVTNPALRKHKTFIYLTTYFALMLAEFNPPTKS